MGGFNTTVRNVGGGALVANALASKARNTVIIRRGVEEYARVIERMTKVGSFPPGAPVGDTGRLRSGIRTKMTGDTSAEIRPNVRYAVFVHEGTRNMQARPFFDRSVEAADTNIERTSKKLAVSLAKGLAGKR